MERDEPSDIDEREESAIAAIREVAMAVRAPERLHARIQATATGARSAGRRRAIYVRGLAAAAVVVAVLVVLLLPGGTPGAPSVSEAASLAVRGASLPAPASNPRAPNSWLDQRVGRVYFPNWSWTFAFVAVGQRTDRLGGRELVTVYYQGHDTTIAYTIVSGSPLARPSGQITRMGGEELRVLSVEGRLVVSWRRLGHTCVLSGMGVTAGELERLAEYS